MSRIRSVHPGLWTDEEFVCLSAMARLLFIGIWNECDDGGCFEWRPLRLKMRILPADSVDMDALLAELVENRCILKYDSDGASYGAVRNFCRFQRPKKPTLFCPQTDEVRNWCGNDTPSKPDSSEPVGNQFRTGGEKSPQKGGREEGRKGNTFPDGNAANAKISDKPPEPPAPAQPSADPDKQFWDEAKAYLGKSKAGMIGKWVKDHGREAVASALANARKAEAVDPVPYIERVLRNRNAAEDAQRHAEAEADRLFDQRYPPRSLSDSEAKAIMGPDEFERWKARKQAA
ncbi:MULTISPECIES: hypothetical protein [unclassified Novosphingobium]|uniref:hypothetical protein n=1 Tax=unclassified Novosphingobium TaxID=2644732 RepID=UPI000D2FC6C5|nr:MULTISPECIES: hypothetical protein [unclassified Novosphingobium]PTR06422.1 hypothetical protein C8K11_12035 [Novosphingobium sp. GV055]PUA94841.1 hypothetical protein C8K12_12035 [Novosphingobium sp. GV061]PUB13766.1 hypothetical protein C8K14_12035 [Novosphingobium sp. GV079]PUB38464.1 hypothetical protein C8K10_12035 [Novosphingobium sp. GV027]